MVHGEGLQTTELLGEGAADVVQGKGPCSEACCCCSCSIFCSSAAMVLAPLEASSWGEIVSADERREQHGEAWLEKVEVVVVVVVCGPARLPWLLISWAAPPLLAGKGLDTRGRPPVLGVQEGQPPPRVLREESGGGRCVEASKHGHLAQWFMAWKEKVLF